MPQLDLLTESARSAINWRYSIDPLKPEERPMMYVSVEGPKQLAVEHGLVMPPLNVLHEEVAVILATTWDAYLFGEPGQVREAVATAHRHWLRESGQRRPV